MADELFRVGVITEPHGIKGEVKVYPTSDDPSRLKRVKEIILDTGKEKITLHPTSVKFFKQFLIFGFEEFTSRNDVEGLRKKELFVTRNNAVKLHKDEYYISDLLGLKVIEENGEEVGTLTDVIETGANDVYEITRGDDTKLLLPAIKQCILEVNIEDGYVKVYVMPGL